ncbi:MAG: N-acetylmuramoyl-L-alanine amidase [Pseudomonadota bacterium]
MKKFIFVFMSILAVGFTASAALGVGGAEEEYLKAKSCWGELKVTPAKARERKAWEHCVGLFEGVHKRYPEGERGAQALFSAGRLMVEIYGKFHKDEDVQAAIKFFNQLVRDYPKDSLADDALFQIGRLRRDPLKDDDRAKKAFEYIVANYPNGDMVAKAKKELESLGGAASGDEPQAAADDEEGQTKAPAGQKDNSPFDNTVAGPRLGAILNSIEVNKGEAATTVSLVLDRKAAYSLDFTPLGPHTKSPPHLDVLLTYTKPGPAIVKEMSVGSVYLAKIEVKKSLLDGGTRLVFQMAPDAAYDVQSKGEKITLRFKPAGSPDLAPAIKGKPVKKVAAPLKGKVMAIVIDPGHGGSDTGAIGPSGLKEKDVALAISKRLAAKLKEAMGATVYMTRDSDATLTLEDRNAFAVAKKADLFISVHANASESRKMSGIETYFLNNASDAAAAKLAKRENRATKKKLSNVEHILSTMLQNYDAAESELLASDVQKSLTARMGRRYEGIRNRRVRSALFYVLVGAKCPAILVESSFISNPKEEKRLKDRVYQAELAGSISDGVQKYFKSGERRMVKL